MAEAEPPQDVVPPVGENPESQLSDFFNNPTLSDLTIRNPDTEGAKQYVLSCFSILRPCLSIGSTKPFWLLGVNISLHSSRNSSRDSKEIK